MPRNIFGEVGGEGLTNPATEDLEMNGFRIFDLPNPLAGQEPVTLDYGEANFASQASVPDQAPYDVYAAFSDELSPLSAGLQPVVVPASRDFTLTHVRCFLTTASGIAYFTINDFRKNGVSFGVAAPGCEFVNPTDTMSVLSSTVIPISVNQGDRFEIVLNPTGTATGLKVVFMGYVSI
jgi:hypothetical protein